MAEDTTPVVAAVIYDEAMTAVITTYDKFRAAVSNPPTSDAGAIADFKTIVRARLALIAAVAAIDDLIRSAGEA